MCCRVLNMCTEMSNVTKKERIATCLTLFLAAAVQIIIIKSFGPENKTIQRIQTRLMFVFLNLATHFLDHFHSFHNSISETA